MDKADILRCAWKHRAHDFARATLRGCGIEPLDVQPVHRDPLPPKDDVARFVEREFRTISKYTRSVEL